MKVVISDNNSVRLVKRQYNQQPTGSTFTEIEAPFNRNYFNTRYEDEIKYNLDYRLQMYAQQNGDYSNYILQELRGQSLRIQFKCNNAVPLILDTDIKVTVTDYTGLSAAFNVALAKKIDNRNYRILYDNVSFINSGGYCAFSFGSCQASDFGVYPVIIESKGSYLNGSIPEYLAVGQEFKLFVGLADPNNVDFGDGNIITSMVFDATLNKYVVVTNKPYTATSTTTAQLITQHQRSTFDIYELYLTDFTGTGCRKISVTTSTDSFVTIDELWESDYLYFNVDINAGLLLFQWSNARDKFGVDFRTGLQNYAYLFCDMYNLQPELNAFVASNETGGGTLLDSSYKRKFGLTFTGMPRHLAEKIALIFAHETVYINGKSFAMVEGSFESSPIESSMLFDTKIEVTETELLGIYSDNYVNTTPTPGDIGDSSKLQIDDDGNILNIGGGYGLLIDADETP